MWSNSVTRLISTGGHFLQLWKFFIVVKIQLGLEFSSPKAKSDFTGVQKMSSWSQRGVAD
jgi:hypothetical protein